jgi:CHAD domain-containing protein/CYTH domain-containing protein
VAHSQRRIRRKRFAAPGVDSRPLARQGAGSTFGPPLPGDFLDLPVERAVRLVAQRLVHAMSNARERLIDPADADALHDFRVAIRRVRSWLRAHQPYLAAGVPWRTLRELKRIARAAGTARDAEVQTAWLRAQRKTRNPPHRVVGARLHRRLGVRQRAADRALRVALGKHFSRVLRQLDESLAAYSVVTRVGELSPQPLTMAAAAAIVVRRDAEELREALRHVQSADSQLEAHRARIAAKRLRYGLEPLVGVVDGVGTSVTRLERLQDALGRWHDAVVMRDDIATEAAAQGMANSLRAAFVALAARLHDARAMGYGVVARDWRGKRGTAFFLAVEAAAHRLARRAPSGREIERKFLLRELPERVRGAESEVIEQGYVPGARLVERLRRVRADGATRLFRTVKLGTGITRIEIEEETSAEVFQAMWRLTTGHRVRKRRYTVSVADRNWEIDDFLDRDGLVLAEVELPAADAPADPPDWLAPFIVREVTDEARFQNVSLAH